MRGQSKCPLRLAVLVSGGGTTLANLIARISDGRLPGVRIEQVISSRADAGGIRIATESELPTQVVPRRSYGDDAAFSEAISDAIGECPADLIAMGGFLSLWRIPDRWRGRVLNIHPALLPQFGGRGMYGQRVHEAVLRAGARESGCTVHVADGQYDHGPIVAWRRVPVLPNDRAEQLARRVAEAECELYPAVLQQVAAHGLGWLEETSSGGGLAL
jgi:formyltetrahydrofolate-dependent phosphoribosylglycinamide formyltransferase